MYVFYNRTKDLESPRKSGNENSEMSDAQDKTAEQTDVNEGNQEEALKHHSSKRKKKKHKHRSKHKKHKHMSVEEKKCKRKHKHKKHRHKEGMPPTVGAIDRKVTDALPSFENPNGDDQALLEDLEKRRALIKAELDSQLMEGKVRSGMRLILQGYNSGLEENGEGQKPGNGEQCQKGSGAKSHFPKDRYSRSGKAKQDSPVNKASTKHHSCSKERDEVTRDSGCSQLINNENKIAKEYSRSKDRRCSQSQNQSHDRVKKSQSPSIKMCSAERKTEQKVFSSDGKEAQTVIHPSPHAEESKTAQEQCRWRSWSPVHSNNHKSYSKYGCSEVDREKRPAKSPSKDASSGKENRSPHQKHASSSLHYHSSSTHQKERQSHQTASSGSKQNHSSSRNRSSAMRGHNHSIDHRRDSSSR